MIVSVKNNNEMIDISVDSKYRINKVLQLLVELGEIFSIGEIYYIYSTRKDEMLSTAFTFEEAGIYNGDILVLGGKQ